MTRTLRCLFILAFIGLSAASFAQEIAGRVLDDKNQPVLSASVQVTQGGILKGGTVTDIDGNYSIKPLDPGFYEVTVRSLSYDTSTVTGVTVSPDKTTTVNFSVHEPSVETGGKTVLKEHKVVAFKKALVDKDCPSCHIIERAEITQSVSQNVIDIAATSAGVYQSQKGAGLNIGGARTEGTLYIVDGVQVQGSIGVEAAQGSVDQIEVMSSGVSAKYGDFTGGVVNITSRGVSQKLTGDIMLQHSIDGYNNNLASFSFAGPLIKKKTKDGSKPIMGFSLSGDIYDDHDRSPTYDQLPVLKGSALQALQQNPLKIVSDNSGNPVYNYASDYITANDWTYSKIPPNNVTQEYRLNGKLDLQVADNMNISAGGSFNYSKVDLYNRGSILYAPESIPYETTLSGRGYIRFTQRFGKAVKTAEDEKSVISNAFYTIQADYQKEYQSIEDPTFKKNIFDYGYVGKFNETRTEFYQRGTDSVSGIQGIVYAGGFPNSATGTGISYDRSNLNPVLANYTSEYYNSLNGALPSTINQIQASNAMANGDEPQYTYGLVLSPGATQNSYSNFNSNQYAFSIDASFDLQTGKVKHQIEFGLSYQQRVEKSYTARANYSGAGTNSLWQLMRGLVSSKDNGGLALDKLNPIFVVNGHQYTLNQVQGPNAIVSPGANDTIIYNYKNVGNSYFDSTLRKQLGLSKTQDINIDALDPSTFSLGLFSADELLNSGNPFVSYEGYTYTGGQQAGNVSFNDFFTAKDANGNYTRPIGSFNPNYIAGYLLDKFTYKDIHFNVGVRVDRYSANTKVLIDPYSEYPEKDVNQVNGSLNTTNNGHHPANIGGNYVVYVDDNASSNPTIIGYRNGNNWYDPTGKYVEDPTVLKQYSGGRDPQPYLTSNVKITDSNFNPNNSFTDYTPQVTVMPRVSFSFPISDVADFYAHYDIYAQRPTTGIDATAYDYYYLAQNSNSIVNNANLKPQKTFDYEVGFQQKLSDRSALTLTGFYKERKDMITVQPYLYAYPTTYYTFGNRDFSTTKGMTLNYDLRRFNHLRLNIAYTLQFAEGTGSSPYSTNSGGGGQISPNGLIQTFISAGVPNLRYVSSLDYDSRHTIAATADYRFDEGEGPIVGGMRILQNAGLNFIFRVRSGEPYTAYSTAPSSPEFSGGTVVGGVNGSRLPWHYGVDAKIDKDFALNPGVKKHHDGTPGIKPKRPLYLNVYLRVENVLNTREVLHVYGYTGRANDDGYLSSPFGQTYVPQQVSPQSYADLYRLSVNNPYNYNLPRTMTLGLKFDF